MTEVTSNRAVVVLAVGDRGRELLSLTGDGIRAYAARVGADYHVIDGEPIQPDYPLEDKFRVGQYLDHYDRLVYFDADITVRPDAPDLFALVPEDKLGITNELRYGDYRKDFSEVQKANGFKVTRPTAYYNSGLMVLSRRHKPVMAPPAVPYKPYHTAEQDLINARIIEYGVKTHEFGPDLVWLYFADKKGRRKQGRPFLHYAGASQCGPGHLAVMTGFDPFAPALTAPEKEKLLDLLRRVDLALGEKCFLSYGALLGQVRHGDLLPWDDDVDVLCVDPPAVEELQARLPGLGVLRDRNGLIKVFDPKDQKAPGHPHSFPFVDVAPAVIEEGKLVHYCTNGPTDRFPLDWVYPLVRGQVGGVEVNLPAKPRELLVQKYGPECLVSAKPSYWSHRHERPTGFPEHRVPLSELLPRKNPDQHYLINLARRPDRKEEALKELAKAGITPKVVEAIDGRALPLPIGWKDGSGAYGCRESHRRVLEDAILRGLDWIVVFEDDVTLVDDYQARFKELLALLPDDWDAVFLGGQHKKTPEPVKPGLVRCTDCHRTHAYMLRGNYIKALYQIWSAEFGHVDHVWGRWQAKAKCYAPEKWLAGQGASKSDINLKQWGTRFWQPAPVRRGCGGCRKKGQLR